MAYRISEEQEELRRAFRRLLEKQVTSEYLRKRVEDKKESDPNLWQSIAELGFAEYFTGEGLDEPPEFSSLSLVAHECGRALLPEPLMENLLVGPYLLGVLVKENLCSDNLAELRLGLGYSWDEESQKFSVSDAGVSVSGSVKYVLGAGEAQGFVVVHPEEGVLLSVKAQEGVRAEAYSNLLDRSMLRSTVFFDGVPFTKVSAVSPAQLLSLHAVLLASELSGLCERVVEMTADYVKTRKQFEVPVGSFQAVQHGLADMYLKTEALRSLTHFAAWSADHSPEQLEFSALAVKSFAASHAPWVVEKAIQLHGGIGFTWEHDLHLYLRRAKSLAVLIEADNNMTDRVLQLAAAS